MKERSHHTSIYAGIRLCLFSLILSFAFRAECQVPIPVNYPPNGNIYAWGYKTDRTQWETGQFLPFIYNRIPFRMLLPSGLVYNQAANTFQNSSGEKFPLVVFLHGPGLAGTDNGYQLNIGGKEFLDAYNAGVLNGIVIFPHNYTGSWGATQQSAVLGLINNLVDKGLADPFAISMVGVSSGGTATWSLLAANPQIFSGAIPMSAAASSTAGTTPAFIHIPVWLAQGAYDKAPNPTVASALVASIQNAGGNIRYSYYEDIGHGTWNRMFYETGFYHFLMNVNKTNPHVFFGKTEFCAGDPIQVKLGVTAGFEAYEWRKDGEVMPVVTTNEIVVNAVGIYEVRIRRNGSWSYWSRVPVKISYKTATITPEIKVAYGSSIIPDVNGNSTVALALPDGYAGYSWLKVSSNTLIGTSRTITINSPGEYTGAVTEQNSCVVLPSPSFHVLSASAPHGPSAAINVSGHALSTSQIELAWDQNQFPQWNETGFEIWRSNSLDGPYQMVQLTAQDATEWMDNNLIPNTEYYYKVRAINHSSAANPTPAISIKTFEDNSPPAAPRNLRITSVALHAVALAWETPEVTANLARYEIFANGIKMLVTTSTAITAFNLPENQIIKFHVSARYHDGNLSPASNFITTITPPASVIPGVPPGPPAELTATAQGYGAVLLTWVDTISNKTGFQLWRASGETEFFPVGTTDANATAFTDETIEPGTSYRYKALAMGLYGESVFSITAVCTTDALPPVPADPSGLVCQALSTTSIRLTFHDNSDNESLFEVYRSTENNSRFIKVTSLPSGETGWVEYIDDSLFSHTTYHYRIRAIGMGGFSGYSNETSGKTFNNPPVLTLIGNRTMHWGTNMTLTLKADDVDGSMLEFAALNLPDFAQLNDQGNGTASLVLNPSEGETGVYPGLVISVSDQDGGHDADTITITVNNNFLPVISPITNSEINEAETLTIPVTVTDPEGGTISIRCKKLPDFASLSSSGGSGSIILTPGFEDQGTYNMEIEAEDNLQGISTFQFSVQVNDVKTHYRLLINYSLRLLGPAPWNNLASLPNAGAGITGLKDMDFDNTTVSVTLANGWETSTSTGEGEAGMNTGNNSGIYPDNVMDSYYYTNSTTYKTIRIGGLNKNLKYNITFFASRDATSNATGEYRIGNTTVTLNAARNVSNKVMIPSVVPDSNGNIFADVRRAATASFAYLNAMEVEAYLDQPAPIDNPPSEPVISLSLTDNGDNTVSAKYGFNEATLLSNSRFVWWGSSTMHGSGADPAILASDGKTIVTAYKLKDRLTQWVQQNVENGYCYPMTLTQLYSDRFLPDEINTGDIDQFRNIDAVLSLKPTIIILSLPTNDIDLNTNEEFLNNLISIDEKCRSNGVFLFVTTTQPRDNFTVVKQQRLRDAAQLIRAYFKERCIDIMDELAQPYSATAPARIKAIYAAGDQLHLNNAGHEYIFNETIRTLTSYFTTHPFVKYALERSELPESNFTLFRDNLNVLSITFPRENNKKYYYRIRAQRPDATFTPYSRVETLHQPIFIGDVMETIHVNCTLSGEITNLAGWNDFVPSGNTANSGEGMFNLVNTSGTPTSVGIQVMGDYGAAENLGRSAGSIYPAPASKSYWRATVTSSVATPPQNARFRFVGLDDSYAYTIKIFPSRTGFGTDRLVAAHALNKRGLINACSSTGGNISEEIILKGLRPINGEIPVFMRALGYGIVYQNVVTLQKHNNLDPNSQNDPLPEPPQRLTHAQVSSNSVTLTWEDHSDYETGFEVYRSQDGSGFTKIATRDANVITCIDTTLTSKTQYFYRVRAVNFTGPSDYSNVLDVTTPAVPPLISVQPTIKLPEGSNASLVVSCTDVDDPAVIFNLSNNPAFIQMTQHGPLSATLDIVPPAGSQGVYTVTLTADDEHGGIASREIVITVNDFDITSTYVNFCKTSIAIDPWNNMNASPALNLTKTNLLDEQHLATGINLTLLDAWKGVSSSGAITGNNSGIYPDEILKTSYYENTTATRRIRLTGLQNTRLYNFIFFGSRSGTGDRTTIFSIGSQFVSLNTSNNTTRTVALNSIKPSASGEVIIQVRKDVNASYADLNALIIQSFTDTGIPMSPTGLFVSNASRTSIGLQWRDNSFAEAGFEIWRSSYGSDNFSRIAVVPGNATAFADTTLPPGSHSYKVRAIAADGENFSSFSNTVKGSLMSFGVYINFNDFAGAQSPWNNLPAGLPIGWNSPPLKDELGNTTGFILTVVKKFDGENNLGMNTGNNSGVFQDAVLRGSNFIEAGWNARLMISGLDFRYTYSFVFCGSRQGTGDKSAVYTIEDQSVVLNASGNTSGIVQIDNVKPGEDGTVGIDIVAPVSSTQAYINAMVIKSFPGCQEVPARVSSANARVVSQPDLLLQMNSEPETKIAENPTAFPNPFDNTINIDARFDYTGNIFFELFGPGGKRVTTGELKRNETSGWMIDLAETDLPSGLYFLKLSIAGGRTVTLKMIKK